MYTLEVNDKLLGTLNIVVEGEEFKALQEEAISKFKNSKIDGFRKGHAPLDVIKKTFEGQINEEIFNKGINEGFAKALKEKNEEVLGKVDVVKHSLTNDKLEVTLEFEVKPKFELPQYKGLDIKVEEPEVTAEMVDAAVEQKAKSLRTYETIEGRDVAEKGDVANINFEGFVDGVAFEGGKGENFDLELGSNTFIPGFEDQIEGHKLEEEFDVNVMFPEEYHVESLKAKPAVFKVKINALKKVVTPEVNDDLAKKQGYDTLEDYKKATKANLELQREQKLKDKKYQAIADKLVETVEMNLPEKVVVNEKETELNDLRQRLAMQGMTLEQLVQNSGQTMEEFEKDALERAAKVVKFNLMIGKIAQENNIVVNDADIDGELVKMASMYGMTKDQIVEELKKANMYENYMNQMAGNVFISKIREFLLSNN